MRTTIEVPDDLLVRARTTAAHSGLSLKQFFISAIEVKLASLSAKTRHSPPEIGSAGSPPVDVLTSEQIDEAMFGSLQS